MRQYIERLADRSVATPDAHDADGAVAPADNDRFGYVSRRGRELTLQTVEHHLIFGGILGVSAELVMTGAAREIRRLGAGSGQRSIGNGIIVAVKIAIDFFQAVY